MTKKWIQLLFWIYFLMLMNFIVFKFFGDVNEVLNRMMINKNSVEMGSSSLVNLIPYSKAHLILNVILFIPFGILFPLAYPSRSSFLSFTVIALLSILGIELTQRLTYLGIFDVDDIFLNFLGCLIGYIVYKLIKR